MNIETKKEIVDYISKKDPNNKIIKKISVDDTFTKGKIEYNKDNLLLHRNISNLTDEEYVRAYLVVKLITELKYPVSSIELEKKYEAGRPKTIKPRIDIIVKDKRKLGKNKNDRSFLFIEVKSPDKFDSDKDFIEGQLFNLAALEDKQSPVQYLTYYSVKESPDKIDDRALIINFLSFPSFESWIDAGQISLDRIPKEYDVAHKLIYTNKKDSELKSGEKNLDRKVSHEKFNTMRKDLHNVLWGGGGMNYNDVFSNLVKLFLAKIYDEYTTPYEKPYSFQIEFKDDVPEAREDLFIKINILFKQAQKEFLGYSDAILEHSVGIDQEKISQNKVAYVVEQLQGISLLENENKDDSDLLGQFFEGIVSEGFKQDKGQFFTHHNIVAFVLNALKLDELTIDLVNGKENPVKPRLPYICDPACGSGTFLINAMKLITSVVKKAGNITNSKKTLEFTASNFPDLTPNVWAKEYVYGCEISPDLGLATKVNMVLHGDGNMNIFVGDTQGNGLNHLEKYSIQNKISVMSNNYIKNNFSYKKPVNEKFDVIISNPPFSIEKKALPPKEQLSQSFLFFDKANSENLFVERWFQLLREKGRLGAVLPEAVFDTTENLYIRLFLYRYFIIKAIISLPLLTFQPFTMTKTVLLFAQKKTKHEVDEYEKKWREFHNEFQRLKRKITSYKTQNIKDEKKAKGDLKRFLKQFFQKEDESLSINELLEKYNDEISELEHNSDWWTFSEVSNNMDYNIFMAEANDIGYKRTKRGEKKFPNQLFQVDERGDIIIDEKNLKTILDWFEQKVKWD